MKAARAHERSLEAQSVGERYDRLAQEYARRIFDELLHKPLDRERLARFAAAVRGSGEVSDMGCGPGRVARHLRVAGATLFGLGLAPGMLEQARRLNSGLPFRKGVATKICARTNYGGSPSRFTSSFSGPRKSGVVSRRQGSPLKRSSGGIGIRKWSIKAGKRTFLPERALRPRGPD